MKQGQVSNILSNNLNFCKQKTSCLIWLSLKLLGPWCRVDCFEVWTSRFLLRSWWRCRPGRSFEGATHFEDIRSMLDAFLIIIILAPWVLFGHEDSRKRNLRKTYDVLKLWCGWHQWDRKCIKTNTHMEMHWLLIWYHRDNLKVKGSVHSPASKNTILRSSLYSCLAAFRRTWKRHR